MSARIQNHRKHVRRRGVSAVEMALIAPILITVVFGIIEFGWAFMVRQLAANAAREGARVAAIQATENDNDIRDAVKGALASLNNLTVPDDNIDITHWCENGDGSFNYTETVEVTIPYDDISLLGDFFSWIDFHDIVTSSTMRKEGVQGNMSPPSGMCAG